MRRQRVDVRACLTCLRRLRAAAVAFAQVGRGGSQWLTALADAQRTSWIRTDDKISVDGAVEAGFELQWTSKLDNQPRGAARAGPGRHGERRHAVRADVGRRRQLEQRLRHRQRPRLRRLAAALRRAARRRRTGACPGGITAGGDAHRQSRLRCRGARFRRGFGGGRGVRRLSQPARRAWRRRAGRGPCGRPGRAGAPAGAPARRRRVAPTRSARRAAAPALRRRPLRRRAADSRSSAFPARREAEEGGGGPSAFSSGRPASSTSSRATACCTCSACRRARTSRSRRRSCRRTRTGPRPIAVDTTLYAATSGNCGGAPNGVWAIDLDSEAKPVVSWKTNGGERRRRRRVHARTARSSRRSARARRPATARPTRSSRSMRRRCS